MFFPASAPLNLSVDARLVWNVNAKTDRAAEKIALKAPNGKYVCAESGGGKELVANRGAIGDWETFELIFVDEHKVALKAQEGQYVGVDHVDIMFWEWNSLVANRDTIGQKETFTLERKNDQIALKAHNGKYVCVGCGDGGRFQPEWLYADSANPVYFELIELEETDSRTTTLAKYKEDFMLTGFSVEESYGSEVGVFYSDDKDRTLEADFVMAYEFLRNTTTHVADMPSILTANNVTVVSNTSSFSHQDEALVELTGNMTPDALD